MTNREREQDLKPMPVAVYGLAGAAAAALIVGVTAFVVPQPAGALPAYAQQTGLACGRCHTNPAGGGALTSFGKAFAANGHKLPSKKGTSDKSSETAAPGKKGAGATATPAGPVESPAPSWGYFGPWPIILDYAQAQALSLRYPYYSHFLYDYCDYRNCRLERKSVVNPDGTREYRWEPVWYGPRS